MNALCLDYSWVKFQHIWVIVHQQIPFSKWLSTPKLGVSPKMLQLLAGPTNHAQNCTNDFRVLEKHAAKFLENYIDIRKSYSVQFLREKQNVMVCTYVLYCISNLCLILGCNLVFFDMVSFCPTDWAAQFSVFQNFEKSFFRLSLFIVSCFH